MYRRRRSHLRPVHSFLGCSAPLQSARRLVGDSAGEPALIEEDVEVVFAEGLAVLNAEGFLEFTGLAGAGRHLALSLFGLFNESGMNGQAHQEAGSVFVGFEGRRREAVLAHDLQNILVENIHAAADSSFDTSARSRSGSVARRTASEMAS